MGTPFERPGLLVPPMTPYRPDGRLDGAALADQLDYIIEGCGATAIVALGVEAQEYRFLSVEDRKHVIAETVDLVDGRVPTIAGAAHPNYRTTVELGRAALDAGAEAIQVLIPPRAQGGALDINEVVAYFERVAEGVDRPLVAYHNPRAGADMGVEGLRQVAELDGVATFKESSRNLRHVLRLIEDVDRAGLANYYTTMEMLLITLLAGGAGATMPAPAAAVGGKLIAAFERGDVEAAMEHQRVHATYPAEGSITASRR